MLAALEQSIPVDKWLKVASASDQRRQAAIRQLAAQDRAPDRYTIKRRRGGGASPYEYMLEGKPKKEWFARELLDLALGVTPNLSGC
eukprot:COSAG04_NODE_524_length_13127_cov_18.191511_24_plen_87_part_00